MSYEFQQDVNIVFQVTACYYRELEIFQNVVVLPINGYRSLANQLAGGGMPFLLDNRFQVIDSIFVRHGWR